MQKQDDLLIQRVLNGDDAAFEELVSRYSPAVFRTISRLVSDRAEAEAVVQDAWLRAWSALPRYRTGRPFLPWLLKIAVNRSRDIWKKKKETLFSDLDFEEDWFEDEESVVETKVIRDQELDRLAEGVSYLRAEYRMVIALRYDGDLSYQQIADTLEIPLNTVRTYLRRAKSELQEWMEADHAG